MNRPSRFTSSLGVLVAVVLAVALVPAPVSLAASDGEDVVVEGSGWGHGIGMSQYGAYGMALNGYSTGQILAHYYQGTSVTDASNTSAADWISGSGAPLWIGLMQDRSSALFTFFGGGGNLCHAGDCGLEVDAASGETWRFSADESGSCRFQRVFPSTPAIESDQGPCTGAVKPASSTTVRMHAEGFEYSSGTFRFRAVPSDPSTFHVALQIGVDNYLRGIAEMPTSWHLEALKAQVIAARSYLMANVSSRGPQSSFSSPVKELCWCHLYDDSRSQVYKGDILLGSSNWQSAVSQTANQVISHGGTLVRAFYSSSSGGRTENVEDYWGGSGVPWLVSVDDSWAHISAVNNPRSSWARTLTPASLASKVGLDDLLSVTTSHRDSGGAEEVTFVGKINGSKTTVVRSGSWVRSTLGLYSQYFDMSWTAPQPVTDAYEATDDGHKPIGWVDSVTGRDDGSLRVRGWTLDFDTPLPIDVHIYVDGRFAYGGPADGKRRDVETVHKNGSRHGFDTTIETGAGSHTVCVYAINAPSRTGNSKLGCRAVTVTEPQPESSPSPPKSDPSVGSKPFGWVDSLAVSSGVLRGRGWAIDADAPEDPVSIHVYVDGSFFWGGRADDLRRDVGRVHQMGDRHGFSFEKDVAVGSHRVCVFAINIPERTGNPTLSCKTVGS